MEEKKKSKTTSWSSDTQCPRWTSTSKSKLNKKTKQKKPKNQKWLWATAASEASFAADWMENRAGQDSCCQQPDGRAAAARFYSCVWLPSVCPLQQRQQTHHIALNLRQIAWLTVVVFLRKDGINKFSQQLTYLFFFTSAKKAWKKPPEDKRLQ